MSIPGTPGLDTCLWPWTTDLKNPLLGRPLLSKPSSFEGITDSRLPSSASQVPFVWSIYKEYDYQFLGGVLTIEQDKESRAIRPRIGWAVRPASQAGQS